VLRKQKTGVEKTGVRGQGSGVRTKKTKIEGQRNKKQESGDQRAGIRGQQMQKKTHDLGRLCLTPDPRHLATESSRDQGSEKKC
jgi:hypothetical protein